MATERFMREAGYRLSLANQRQCRLFWKRLFEIRRTGVDKILLYRIKEFFMALLTDRHISSTSHNWPQNCLYQDRERKPEPWDRHIIVGVLMPNVAVSIPAPRTT